ncbi:4079_t:CDS:2 [Diversispora eburnea]|uniref:4079_t:CDS:1 n=1 Tax=Diversispora eburnea TaxID=1213867 RepID=A0A9N9FAC4_9GLOM|nr:4079_t:CDS:2 [Diversispora eburnea]
MNIPFVTRPLSTLRYLAAEYPVYVWSIGLGALVPKRPRNHPAGYEDP